MGNGLKVVIVIVLLVAAAVIGYMRYQKSSSQTIQSETGGLEKVMGAPVPPAE